MLTLMLTLTLTLIGGNSPEQASTGAVMAAATVAGKSDLDLIAAKEAVSGGVKNAGGTDQEVCLRLHPNSTSHSVLE